LVPYREFWFVLQSLHNVYYAYFFLYYIFCIFFLTSFPFLYYINSGSLMYYKIL